MHYDYNVKEYFFNISFYQKLGNEWLINLKDHMFHQTCITSITCLAPVGSEFIIFALILSKKVKVDNFGVLSFTLKIVYAL